MPERIESIQNNDKPPSAGISFSAVMGFLFLLRVGELGGLQWKGVSIFIGLDGGAAPRRELPRPKTDQYNEGHVAVLKAADRPIFPVMGFARRLGSLRHADLDDSPAPGRNSRKKLAHSLKLAET